MQNIYLSLIPAITLVAALTISPAAFAEADVLQPPTAIHDSDQARETVEAAGDKTDLNRELSAPDTIEGGEVHSYERKDGAEVTEYSVKGKVYMIRVQPGGDLPAYYLYDSNGDGVFEQRLPGGYKRPSPPMWVIKKF